jgi:hypothetical protein
VVVQTVLHTLLTRNRISKKATKRIQRLRPGGAAIEQEVFTFVSDGVYLLSAEIDATQPLNRAEVRADACAQICAQ